MSQIFSLRLPAGESPGDDSPARLPPQTVAGALARLAVSVTVHVVALVLIASVVRRAPPMRVIDERTQVEAPAAAPLPRLVFLAPRGIAGAGGGGGGNRDASPIRHAEARGHDRATLRTRQTVESTGPALEDSDNRPPAVLLDARSLASGDSPHVGLPTGGVSYGTSQGPGTGGGVGTGVGTGIGPGRGPGIGAGEGGGTGGGVYRPGGGVTTPRLLVQVEPRYTTEALDRRIQGAVWLDLVVTRAGVPANIRVVRSLDPGLDEEAIRALRQWRFAPGTLAGSPVDVQVNVMMDFRIH